MQYFSTDTDVGLSDRDLAELQMASSQTFIWPEIMVMAGTTLLYMFGATALYTLLRYFIRDDTPYPGFPLIGKLSGDWFGTKTRARWDEDAIEILKEGDRVTEGRPFQILSSFGPCIVLPKEYCNEIRNDSRLSFRGFIERQALVQYPGLDVIHTGVEGDIIQDTIRKNLNQALGGMTASLSQECALVVAESLPQSKDWKQTKFIMASTNIAARLSALVFLGERLCHRQDWIDTSIRFTVVMMRSQAALRAWPVFMRRIVCYFLPELIYLRQLIRQARDIIEPELAYRRASRAEVVKPQDSLSWLDDVRQGRPFDVVSGQLFLTVAAIHTTSTVLTATMYDLISNPAYIGLLREEIVRVYNEDGGWKKTSLYKLKLMDSCMKESQRLNILGPNMMNRYAEADVTLSDGTFIPKGSHITIPTFHMRDPDVFGSNADEFDGYRFLRMRDEPGQENKWQFVSTSPEFLSFGHGKHACPGRFFASNEIKIALIHLLLKYDWDIVGLKPGSAVKSRFVPNPETLIQYRSRTPEIEI
ncbi:cytochrome p450 [Colletotrichum karsti]|uniref:Cytochrome p450 n=1 Tax=Colletotrichum karsti TaxID=1095194 RepID=A0A9P6LD60_9PEZI|nr:cytochrome p450 [Colletotrichum karsti]KAF9870929.1 cytochrome p450 [Colletotrichum karsti]